MNYLLIFMLLILFWPSMVQAQMPDSTEAEIQLLIEDAMTTSDNQNSEQDWTIITDYLNDLTRKPLNLNVASRADLSPIPGFNELLINNLFQYIKSFGKLTSLYEL